MVSYGVNSSGFTKKPLTVILADMKTQAQLQFGVDVDLTPSSPLLQFIQAMAVEQSRVWDMSEALYYSAFVDFATGASLDNVVIIVGLTRNPATKATGQVTFSGTNGTIIPVNTVIQTSTAVGFVTDAQVTISGGTAAANITAQLEGADGNVTSNTITILPIPISGVTSVTNAAATSGGADIETDTSLRERSRTQLAQLGKGTVDAIRSAVAAVAGVTYVGVTEDTTAHTVTVTVVGLTIPNADVTAAVDGARPAGIPASIQNASSVNIYVDATVDIDATTAPTTAQTDLRDAIIDFINGLNVGDDVVYTKLYDVLFNVGTWVLDVTNLKTGTAPGPTGTTNITISSTQKAVTDNTKVNITTA